MHCIEASLRLYYYPPVSLFRYWTLYNTLKLDLSDCVGVTVQLLYSLRAGGLCIAG